MSGTTNPIDSTMHESLVEGVRTVALRSPSSWDVFHQQVGPLAADYIWRGQRQDKPLNTTFDRDFRITEPSCRELVLKTHLARFVEEMDRSHPGVLTNQKDKEKWALGQHYGLRTPLLDWTKSPDIAAYFALQKRPAGKGDCYRYVYALKARSVSRLLRKLKRKRDNAVLSVDRFLELIADVSFRGSRLDAQEGVFTMALNGEDIETNVRRWNKKRPDDVPLVKFQIPTEDRDSWLHKLNAMPKPINGVMLQMDLRDAIDRCR